jgi:hypothetical protein
MIIEYIYSVKDIILKQRSNMMTKFIETGRLRFSIDINITKL